MNIAPQKLYIRRRNGKTAARWKKSPFLFLCEFVHIVISAAILAMCDAVDADDGKENSIKENT